MKKNQKPRREEVENLLRKQKKDLSQFRGNNCRHSLHSANGEDGVCEDACSFHVNAAKKFLAYVSLSNSFERFREASLIAFRFSGCS